MLSSHPLKERLLEILKKLDEFLIDKLYFGFMISIQHDSINQFAISALLFFGRPTIDNKEVQIMPHSPTELISSIFGFLFIFNAFILMPYLSILIVVKRDDWLYHKKVMKYIGKYYYHLRKDKSCLAYNLVFTIRRITISIYATQLFLYPGQQIQLLLFQNVFCLILVGNNYPFVEKRQNQIELFNEFVIDLLTIVLFGYTQFLTDPIVKYDLGWVSIILFSLLIILNFGRIILRFLVYMKLVSIKLYKILQKKYDEFEKQKPREVEERAHIINKTQTNTEKHVTFGDPEVNVFEIEGQKS